MSDIVERLQNLIEADPDEAMVEHYKACLLEIERLREALRAVAAYKPGSDHQAVLEAVRRAMEHKT